MRRWSRRHFGKSCLCLAAAGLGSPVLSILSGCECNRTSVFKPDTPEKDPETLPLQKRRKSPARAVAFEPAYLKLHRSGELKQRGQRLWRIMQSCELCPRQCGANRLEGEKGFCHSTSELEIFGFHPHFGEERPLVGKGGSGTIFLSNCSLRCVFCLNWEISQGGEGKERSLQQMAEMMLRLQEMGCPNINVVTPTHYSAHIVRTLDLAAAGGLRLPLVYNTCGWERIEILKKLDGIVDIYLPDMKYMDSAMAARYSSNAADYPEVTKKAIAEMHRQVGVLASDRNGVARRGLIIRHLVMPNRVAGTEKLVRWIAKTLPRKTYVNIMSQYHVDYKAYDHPQIARGITVKEYLEAMKWAAEAGLTNLDPKSVAVRDMFLRRSG